MPELELERRNGAADNGDRRRRQDAEETWRLRRDKLLFGIGAAGVTVITLATVLLDVKSEALALALVTLFGGLLGAPTILRLDERRRDERQNGR